MAASSGTQPIRKAIAALKDTTKVGLVNLNSENKGLDIAIVKATNHDEVLPKEKHISKILEAVLASRPRADVAYCIQSLAKRLAKTHSWTVALKTLIVIHRALREVDHSFCEELINYSRGRALMFNLSHFRDESSPVAWDHSAWIRNYALYLEERVECFRILRYDVEKSHMGSGRLSIPDLLDQLPSLQQLLFRLLGCKPQGAALYNNLIHYALSIIASESVKLYVSITDGILKLVDKYFEMPRHDAVRTLEIYRKSESQADSLTSLFEICRELDFGRGQKYIKIEKPPASFMTAMEDYVKVAPHIFMLQYGDQNVARIEAPKLDDAPGANVSTDRQDSDQPGAAPEPASNDRREAVATQQLIDTEDTQQRTDQSEAAASQQITDLLGLEELTQQVSEMDEKNSLALAIVTSENQPNSENSFTMACQTMSWELALVTAPSSNVAAVAGSKLAGGLDKLTLDSLYDDAIARNAKRNSSNTVGQQVGSNPFEADSLNQDPFSASSGVTPPANAQMSDMIQQQNFMTQQQQQEQKQEQEPQMIGQNATSSSNPFLDQSLPSHPRQDPFSGLT
ncbi:putative clathrin assembly protein At5g35200 [Citrus sinensis]|uniref:putative clathrin assembly protein At5g35200 n=1 Tax=Citrus sinensis TaxID=2711 RepID=UPI0003D75F95|nr:putative clathrin assembly protein At5g35200 [Citrus sinensis]XP_024034182.1 putative clathrin assembly protein At5g35200 [Citrus x clementina]